MGLIYHRPSYSMLVSGPSFQLKLTPAMPDDIARMMKSSAHSVEPNVLLTPASPPQETLLVSSTRSGIPVRWEIAATLLNMRVSAPWIPGLRRSSKSGR